MLPKIHPIAKTAIELRRAKQRLEHYQQTSSESEYMDVTKKLIQKVDEARRTIPAELYDVDKKED